MTEELKLHLPTIIAVTFVCIIATYFALTSLHGAVDQVGLGALETMSFLVPSIVMVIGSLIIMATSHAVTRQIYVCIVVICLVTGAVATVLTNSWFVGTDLVPPLQNFIALIRNLAAFFVAPTIGCIAGAWIGSRLHPMKMTKAPNKKKPRK